jgi:type II secretory ATPase GspE/PulE/Tfp pilus assembly ATPase PilB-like protein
LFYTVAMLFGHREEEGQPAITPDPGVIAPASILGAEATAQLERLYGSPQTAPEIVELLLNFAAEKGISDVLFEPTEDYTLVRMRLDGILQDAARIPLDSYPAVSARIKVMSAVDTGQRQINEEGKFLFKYKDRDVSVRMALTGVAAGEMIALRLHDSASAVYALKDHGMGDSIRERFEKMISAKTGLVIVCGPTGAGKTSTLYSSLNLLNTGRTNIISIEDPVEYVLKGVNQMQVANERGLSFASGLRVILRLNPDIIFVGEVRDQETAKISIEASLTGHLVMTTLHANSAVSAISRLRDLQVEDFFINAALKGVICQRLVRRTCTTCGVWQVPNADESRLFQQIMGTVLEKEFIGAGCDACAGTGFQGRIGVYELLEMSDTTRPIINAWQGERETFLSLRNNAGFKSLVEDGMEKVVGGMTTVMEVVSNAYAE